MAQFIPIEPKFIPIEPSAASGKKQQLLSEQAEVTKEGERLDRNLGLITDAESFFSGMTPSGAAQVIKPVWDELNRSPIKMSRVSSEELKSIGVPGVVADVGAGAQQGMADMVEGVTTPLGVLTMGVGALPRAIQKVVNSVFVGSMVKNVPEQVSAAAEAAGSGDVEGATRAGVGAAGSTVFAKTVADHTVGPQRMLPVEPVREAIAQSPEMTRPVPKEQIGLPPASAGVKLIPIKGSSGPSNASMPPMPGGGMTINIGKQGQGGFLNLPPAYAPKINAPFAGPDVLPDYLAHPDARTTFARHFAWDKVPLMGQAMGGKYRLQPGDPVMEPMAVYFSERYGVGPAQASALATRLGGELNKAFKTKWDGDLIGVVANDPNSPSLKLGDVIEGKMRDPASYTLTPRQQELFDLVVKPLAKRTYELKQKYGLLDPTTKGPYFPRGTVMEPGEGVLKQHIRTSVGARQGFQRERLFPTEAEGWQQGYRYSRNIEERIVQDVEQMYRGMADKRLAQNLPHRTPKMVRDAINLDPRYAAMSAKQRRAIAQSVIDDGRVDQPAFRGRVFDPQTVETLKQELDFGQSPIGHGVALVNSISKGLMFGTDWGVGQIQGVVAMPRHPVIWTKAQTRAASAMLSKDFWTNYGRRNMSEIQELAKLGVSVGRLEEYNQGAGTMAGLLRAVNERYIPNNTLKGKLARAPLEAPAAVLSAFNRQFHVFLDVAKVEMWKAYKKAAKPNELPEVAKGIESILMSSGMERDMVSSRRSALERYALNAPSMYRGALNLVGMLTQKGVQRKMAFQALGSFTAAMVAMYYYRGLQNGMSKEELDERMDPRRADFMMWQADTESGRPINVGFGGVMKSYVRLIAKFSNWAAKSAKGEKNALDMTSQENPLVWWYRNHSSPFVGLAWDVSSGEDALGRPADLKSGVKRFVPLPVQSETPEARSRELMGLSTFPARSLTEAEMARKEGKKLDELTMLERNQNRKKTEAAKYPQTPAEKALSERKALEHTRKVREEINGMLKPENQAFLKKSGLELPGYDSAASVPVPFAGVPSMKFDMTNEEQERYKKRLVVEYDRVVDTLRRQSDWEGLTLEQKKARLQRFLELRVGGIGVGPKAVAEREALRKP